MSLLLDVTEVRGRYDRLLSAHLDDRLSACGCSKQTLLLCMDCGRVTCRCERVHTGAALMSGRCPCEVTTVRYMLVCSQSCARPERDKSQEHPGVCVCGGYLTDVRREVV